MEWADKFHEYGKRDLHYRSGPLGLRRPRSDELVQGPFSPGRRSERSVPTSLCI